MPFSFCHLLSRFRVPFLAALALGSWSPQSAAQNNLGTVDIVTDLKTTSVLVTGATPELNSLANQAFAAHGAFRRQAQNAAFRIAFSPGGSANQVQVSVSRASGAAVLNQTVTGETPRHALLRAADLAVRATINQPGFFASKLAFIGERSGKPEVHTSDLFLGEARPITNDRALAMTPRWSPDGTKLIYTSYFRTGFPDIFILDLASLQRTNFVGFKGTNSGARYSPDGRNVAMVLSGEGNPEIYVATAQGRNISRKTRTTAVEASPVFSPDGTQLLFTSDAAGGPQLYVMPVAGGQARRLPTRISGYCAEPDWSRANPKLIAFTARIGRGFQVAVFDLTTQTARQVSKQAADAVEPSWLADGRHLVFTARSAGQSSLWLLDSESGKATQLSSPAAGKLSQASVLDPR